MQRLILILALASGILALNYVNNHLKKNITHAKVHEVFHNKYTRKSSVSKCTNFDWKMHNATLTATECLNSKFDAEKLSFCHYTERELRKCLDKPKLLLDQCMPSKSKGLPDLVFEMLFGLLDFICKAEGFRLIDL
ncbi:uncharacterized protein [Euwallacea fornicatus]|uniref:uncharacterized protein isoform X2 n=1 Tax=Euwallacea fornicatus TaxID=995702 RepID=UPI00338F4BA1